MTNDWYTQAFIPVLKQYYLAEVLDSTVQYIPNSVTFGGMDPLSVSNVQQVITPALGSLASVPDFVAFSGMRIYPQSLRSTSRYSPSQKAKALGIPHVVDAGQLTNSSFHYATPYYHAFLMERPAVLPTSKPFDFGRFVMRTVVRFSARMG
jgi:hypothetical protein